MRYAPTETFMSLGLMLKTKIISAPLMPPVARRMNKALKCQVMRADTTPRAEAAFPLISKRHADDDITSEEGQHHYAAIIPENLKRAKSIAGDRVAHTMRCHSCMTRAEIWRSGEQQCPKRQRKRADRPLMPPAASRPPFSRHLGRTIASPDLQIIK